MKLRTFISLFGFLALSTLTLHAPSTNAQFPGSGQLPLDPKSIPQFVDPLPHFAYPGARVDATAMGTPLTIEMLPNDQQVLSTGTILPNGTVVSPIAGLTHVWGYKVSNGTVSRGPLWPAYTIEAKRGIPLNVLYLNNLNETYDAVNLPVDQTLHWALETYDNTNPYLGGVPTVVHLHGGEVPDWSDGGPDAWYLPGGADAGHAALTNVYYYPNTQEAATLWFHDHALGVTRLNVYAGLAGFYFLRDDTEDLLHLPGWSGDSLVQEIDPVTGVTHGDPYLPEIEVVIQDRTFDQDGQLFLHSTAPDVPNPLVHPFWVPEFVGDVITVNGKTWPYLSVAPRKYRIRLLNGSNARFYELWLEDMVTKVGGPAIHQVGTDGGLLDVPVTLDPAAKQKLVIAPGERADLVIDFGSVANPNAALPYAVWTLKNSGNAPYPKGGPPNGSTIGRIMQFIVNGQMVGADNSVVTGRATPLEKLANFATGTPAVPVDKRRQLTLNEVMGPGGPLEVLVNNTKWGGHSSRPYDDFSADPSGLSSTLYSEVMQEGETEVWQIINMTADAHPIHLHLVQFQLLSRQKFNVNKYNKTYNNAFVAAGFPAGFEGGWGPPLDYNTGKDPNGMQWTTFLGGNPDITPFLQGPPMPANPNEQGWKDTYIMYPGEVTTVIVRFTPTDANASGKDYFDFNPGGGHGYVWHCHIIDHEDNEMMRPYAVIANGPAGRIDAPIYTGYQTSHPDVASFAAKPGLAGSSLSAGTGSNELPVSFDLNQNYPNPFNPTTEIRFSLPEQSHVKLVIYNTLGQEVVTLIDGEAPAGQHTVQLDAGNLASGVYFYRLTAGQYTDSKKMVLLK
ncbi:MAG: multicopper oxidase domain-containing protein [Candidatus Zixiibacteriota bacterium]|jgi:FtsP/CotA-like multicopper oxidase with cupredoxin domain